MNYFDLYSSHPDHTITAAWKSQIKEANKAPWIAEALNQHGNELFLCFAACYAEFRALPRSARRSLQRRLARSSELAALLPAYLQDGGRRLQYRMAWSLGGAALLLALTHGVATAATITVTTNNPNIITDGQCSLIEAIVNANDDDATHVDCAAGKGADTIVLPANANVILNSVHGTADADIPGSPGHPIGLPEISSRITIEGNGATIARQAGAPDFGLIAVRGLLFSHTPGDLTLQNATLSGSSTWGVQNRGILSVKNSTVSGNAGVGVFNNPGILTIINSTISGNTGGGLDNSFGAIAVQNSTISDNTGVGVSNYGWGGFYGSVLTLTNSVVTGNQGTEITNVGSYVYADHFNLFGANGNSGVSGFTPGPTDIVPGVSVAQILGPLKNNGGSTQTHALLAGSPAIDVGNPDGCREGPPLSGWHGLMPGYAGNSGALISTDQRGFVRHVDGNNDGTARCDIGAFEFGAEFVPVPLPPPALAIGVTTLATGEAGASFTGDLMISGGVAPYIVAITSGKLPAGLSLGNDGIISGSLSPTARSEKFTVRITDSLNDSIIRNFAITVIKAILIAEKAKTGRVGKNYRASFKTKGGRGPFSWSISAGALPPGLNFNSATGAITGIPTQAGDFPLTVQVTDSLGGVDVETLTLKIR